MKLKNFLQISNIFKIFTIILLFYWVYKFWGVRADYISDAKDRIMPLITGDPDSHDWWYLFWQWGLLDHSVYIGKIVMYIGFFGMLLSIMLMCITLFLKKEYVNWI
jgi:hypothetical protein